MKDKVFAVIVTYNRQAYLRECLDAVLAQSFPLASVVVVNNASSDGTAEMLEADYANCVTRLHMRHNVGGGGGFFRGMAWAYDHGADWIWLMDDDGIPARESLAAMMAPEHSGTFAVMNPLVVCRDDPSVLSFSLEVDGEPSKSVSTIIEHAGARKALPNQINPFNGTLISRETIRKVGLPKREMFIWGDEIDYMTRLAKSGLRFATILNSIHRHPAEKRRRINLGPFGTLDSAPANRIGIVARNMGYIYRTTGASFKLRLFKPIVVSLYYLSQGSLRSSYDFVRYYIDGYFNLFRLAPSRETLAKQGDEFLAHSVRVTQVSVEEMA